MGAIKEIKVPDIGNFKDVAIIEVLVKPGDPVKAEDSIVVLESDKATLEIPSPYEGTVKDLQVKVGSKVSEGALLMTMDVADAGTASDGNAAKKDSPAAPPAASAPSAPAKPSPQPATAPQQSAPREAAAPIPSTGPALSSVDESAFSKAHASPSIRRFARELGVDLGKVKGSGPKGRILKEDVQGFVKSALERGASGAPSSGGFNLPPMPVVDFSSFGPNEVKPLSRIKKLSGAFLHRNWLNIPHVTQHDEADITELEEFRKSGLEAKTGVKVTPLAFLMKASVMALKQFPEFNSSLNPDGESLIIKHYYHIGVAVDTPEGLVVPVIRDVDKKGVSDLAKELSEVSKRARDKKLSPADMQGGCFSISSLGGISGTAFTPIINAPEVAILGVSRAAVKPVYKDGEFVPRTILPLSLSYDHRVIDGAAAARFTKYLSEVLSDIRLLIL